MPSPTASRWRLCSRSFIQTTSGSCAPMRAPGILPGTRHLSISTAASRHCSLLPLLCCGEGTLRRSCSGAWRSPRRYGCSATPLRCIAECSIHRSSAGRRWYLSWGWSYWAPVSSGQCRETLVRLPSDIVPARPASASSPPLRHNFRKALKAAGEHAAVAAARRSPGAGEVQVPDGRRVPQAPRVGVIQRLVPAINRAAVVAGIPHVGQRRGYLFDLDRFGQARQQHALGLADQDLRHPLFLLAVRGLVALRIGRFKRLPVVETLERHDREGILARRRVAWEEIVIERRAEARIGHITTYCGAVSRLKVVSGVVEDLGIFEPELADQILLQAEEHNEARQAYREAIEARQIGGQPVVGLEQFVEGIVSAGV